MEFKELARKRYSCRKYKTEHPGKEVLEQVLESARIAPSAVNFQPWYFIVIDEQEMLGKIHETYNGSWMREAPAIIIVCSDTEKAWTRSDGKNHSDIDTAIAADHMTLQAADLGLGTCWICNFDKKQCKEILDLPDHIEPIVYLPIGYPADNTSKNHDKRKDFDEVVFWNKFDKS